MAKQTVNLGVIPDGVGGDDVRTGFTKVNDNFTELYTVAPQAEAEAGTAQTVRAWTAQRVRDGANAAFKQFGYGGQNPNNNTLNCDDLLAGSRNSWVDPFTESTAVSLNLPALGGSSSAPRLWHVECFGRGTNRLVQEATEVYGSGTTRGRTFTRVKHDAIWYPWVEVLRTGAYGLGQQSKAGLPATQLGWDALFSMNVVSINSSGPFVSYLGISQNTAHILNDDGSGIILYAELYHTSNTTKNPDGTIKASSPVINLYTDHHDLHNEAQFGATPTVTRLSKGVYEVTGTLGLRSDGWYLDTPTDRNGNKYFNVEWSQNVTPVAADGIVDEYRDDIVVTIETFERVWNKETGMFDNGSPIDINELQDRFVQLRFNEIKVEHEELVDGHP